LRIVYLTANVDGAGMYRCLFPAQYLRARGWDAFLCPFTAHEDGDQLLINFRQVVETDVVDGDGHRLVQVVGVDRLIPALEPDVVVVQMQLDSVLPPLIKDWKQRGITVVAECDDAHHGIPAWNPALEGTDPRLHPDRNRDHLHETFKLADALTVATPALKDMYEGLQTDVTVIPNYLHWPMWENVVPPWEANRRRLRVGWMGASKWRTGDLQVLRGVIGPWLERNPHVEFVCAGDPTAHDLLGIPVAQRVSTQAVEFRHGDLADIAAVMDIGLVPLASGGFNECKSWLKGLEYSACGIVPVATPTQQYREFINDGIDGFLAAKPAQWVRALDALLDPELRRRMGEAARAKAREYSLDRHKKEWADFYERVHHHPDRPRPGRPVSGMHTVRPGANGSSAAPGRHRRPKKRPRTHTQPTRA
jgi:glycosyltransferase involved in cell wall biosynthesis